MVRARTATRWNSVESLILSPSGSVSPCVSPSLVPASCKRLISSSPWRHSGISAGFFLFFFIFFLLSLKIHSVGKVKCEQLPGRQTLIYTCPKCQSLMQNLAAQSIFFPPPQAAVPSLDRTNLPESNKTISQTSFLASCVLTALLCSSIAVTSWCDICSPVAKKNKKTTSPTFWSHIHHGIQRSRCTSCCVESAEQKPAQSRLELLHT